MLHSPPVQNSKWPHHVGDRILPGDSRCHRTAEREQRVNVNKIKLHDVNAQPSRQTKGHLVRLELPPKTNNIVAAVAGHSFCFVVAASLSRRVLQLLAPCPPSDGLAVASSMSAFRRTRRGELRAPPRRRNRHLHAFARERVSHRLCGKAWSPVFHRQRWNNVKNAHGLKGRQDHNPTDYETK